MSEAQIANNPLLAPWTGPFEAPPFDRIEPAHFRPAFDAALEKRAPRSTRSPPIRRAADLRQHDRGAGAQRAQRSTRSRACSSISPAPTPMTRWRRSSATSRRFSRAMQRDLSQRGAVPPHRRAEGATKRAWARPPSRRACSTAITRLSCATAPGSRAEAKARLAEIDERLATLGAQFGQNVLADEKDYLLLLGGADDLAGLPDFFVAQRRAQRRPSAAIAGKYAVTLSRSSIEPFLQFSARRDLREKAFRAWAARGENGGATDNRAIAAEMVRLRAERAQLLGFESYAHFRLADTMAKTPRGRARSAAIGLDAGRRKRCARRRRRCRRSSRPRAAISASRPGTGAIYAEKRRKAVFDLDEGEIKPYLQLDNMIEAAFYVGEPAVRPELRPSAPTSGSIIPTRAPGRSWRDGAPIALFIGDYFARASKRSGAWMSAFRDQQQARRRRCCRSSST